MSNRNVAITGGPSNTEAMVTGQQELLVKVNSTAASVNAATETTLAAVLALMQPAVRIPAVLSVTNSGSTPYAYSVSIANVGSAAGLVDGKSIPAGTTLNFDGGTFNNLVQSVTYNATGTTFLISYLY
jgi:hypothetical protein